MSVRVYSVRRFWTAGRGVTPGPEDSYHYLADALTEGRRIGRRNAGAVVMEVLVDRTAVSTRLVACFGAQSDLIRRMVA